MLQIRDLQVVRGGQTICQVPHLDVKRGDRLAVIGPNGSGKTTLLRVAGGLELEFDGECRWDTGRKERVFVHQSPYMFRGSVMFNVTYGLAARKIARKDRTEKANDWLKKLGIGHFGSRYAQSLSGGEQRRVALARALAIEPELLLLDEPFADLDAAGIDAACDAISQVPQCTVVLTSPIPIPGRLDAREFRLSGESR